MEPVDEIQSNQSKKKKSKNKDKRKKKKKWICSIEICNLIFNKNDEINFVGVL